ncbi:hydroxyacid dehydrogenase [Paenibacillus sp. WQ 127069]|uniref:Hydroxyacid dehydrogenase n=1 Tax=Paenibacillus baimaensis TaxID=2982185 RepID=A0ABT2UUI3_9BACL|nr:hydroxyacid dehydrogenase [Paenibacillus sp. WQ 127069]MCU6798320.1 hydroxyacid dehydrogenase [Paenibacillus sp. WQ 127069]
MRTILVQIPHDQIELFFTDESLEGIHQLGNIIWNPHHRPFTEQELCEHIQGVDTVITTWRSAPISEEVLKHADQLKLIAHMAGSVKPILPTLDVYRRGIRVLNSNYAIGVSVSESVLALILALGHKIIPVNKEMGTGRNAKSAVYETYELRGRTVGLIGLGMVAREVIKLLQPFGVKLLGCDPFVSAEQAQEWNVELKPLHDVIAESHIVSLHAPKVPETYQMIGHKELSLLRDGALLINTARGDLIDEAALIEELRKKRFYAGLDVFIVEPLSADSELRHMDNVIVRPHLAGVNPDSRLRIGTLMVQELQQFYNNGPLRFEVKESQLAIMT